MARKKKRDCTECIAYCNMLEGDRCGLGFRSMEDIEGGNGGWSVTVHPYDNECEKIELPTTKQEFVDTASTLGIEWGIDEVQSIEEYESGW